jgi:anaerobic magnesium-protoporphyrin IX monomethyl ester cyclase
MATVLINPNLVVQRNDLFTTGVVYMPIGLAYIAACMRQDKLPINVIDAFAENPRQVRNVDGFMFIGLHPEEVVNRITPDDKVICVYANQLINHSSVVQIISAIKLKYPAIPIVLLENTQAVTAYALKPISKALFDAGADFLLTGEGDLRVPSLVRAFSSDNPKEALKLIDGLYSPNFDNPPLGFIDDLDNLPIPAWDLFPLAGYWNLRYAHGPQSTAKYLPLLTSRGCPYPCRFCVVPSTNKKKWRSRSALSVATEIEFLKHKYGVTEFHLEDLNPTINDARIREMCNEFIERKLGVIWKIVAGTKVESMRTEETIDYMAKAGCRYISISPESGSARVLKLIDKPFNVGHAVKLIKRMNEVGIRSQACFVLGFPDENDDDRELTRKMVVDLAKNGVDEIALFIISPVPGSKIFEQFSGYSSLSELNFTPTWRTDYKMLNAFRLKLYIKFIVWKFIYHPTKIAKQIYNFCRRRFETKMEMVPYKALVLKFLK